MLVRCSVDSRHPTQGQGPSRALFRPACALALAMGLAGCTLLAPHSRDLIVADAAEEAVADATDAQTIPTQEDKGRLAGLREAAPDSLDLAAAWRLAQMHDPRYQAALSALAASGDERAIGRAALLPQVQASAYRGRVRGNRTMPDFTGNRTTTDLGYDSTSASLQLSQPVFDLGRYADYQLGNAQAEEGEARFAVERSQAALRLASAYYRNVLAQGRVDLQEALVDSYTQWVQALEARYARDEGTRTEVAETKARLALAQADAVAARDERVLALRELALMIGREPGSLAAEAAPPVPSLPYPHSLVDWLDAARSRSPELLLAQRRHRLAQVGVTQATAGFLPRASLVASLSHADSEDLDTLQQKSSTVTVGLQVQVPLYAGGYHSADRARAAALRRQAESEVQATLAHVQAEVVRQFGLMEGGVERVAALEEARNSSRFSLQATAKSFEHGLSSNLEVLKAQEALHHAEHELLTARIDWRMAQLQLSLTTDGELPIEESTATAWAKPMP